MAEGAPLLREYVGKTCIEGSNPSDSAKYQAKTGLRARFSFLFYQSFYQWQCPLEPRKRLFETGMDQCLLLSKIALDKGRRQHLAQGEWECSAVDRANGHFSISCC